MRQTTGVAAAALAVPTIVPASVFGADAPSERVTLGVIGAGGKGTGGMRNFMRAAKAQVVAVCDVNAGNRNRAGQMAKLPADRCYEDFRELLARDDIDAVLVATPDHWHVPISKAAVEAGKDVYCEKPLSNTIAEGQALVKAVHKHKAIFQHGTQLRSLRNVRHACELARNGYLGEVRKVTIGSPPGHATGNHPEQSVPDWLNYDLWLGPAPKAPFNHIRIGSIPKVGLKGWYFISDYSKAGWVSGYGVHDIDIAQWGLGTEHTGPVEIEGEGVFPKEGLFDTVLTYRLVFTYADGRQIIMTDTSKHKHGVVFHGSENHVYTRSRIDASDKKLLNVKMKDTDTCLYVSDQHERDFIQCVKSRKQPITPIDVAHRSTSICLIGGICLKLGRKLQWDPKTERFVNDDEANALLSYDMRSPWTV